MGQPHPLETRRAALENVLVALGLVGSRDDRAAVEARAGGLPAEWTPDQRTRVAGAARRALDAIDRRDR